MPIILRTPIRRVSQAEFGEVAHALMRCVFQIHREIGRFFDEKIYKRELAYRLPGVQLEVPVEIVFDAFKTYHYIDVLVNGIGIFEFKTVQALTPRHTAQLLHYLLMAGLDHGKLVNLRSERVEHAFVNTTLRRDDRICFDVVQSKWSDSLAGARRFRELLTSLLRDWGTGLDLQLYETALTHLLGGETTVLAEVEVCTPQHVLGIQKMRMAAPGVAFILTALPEADASYEHHARKLLLHTSLDAILWVNIGLKLVTFTALTRQVDLISAPAPPVN